MPSTRLFVLAICILVASAGAWAAGLALGPIAVENTKTFVAALGFVLLLGHLARDRFPPGARSAMDAGLLVAGLIGGLCWWNLGQFHFPGFAHPRDGFHYYVGSKYFSELGYTGLYACTALADDEAGIARRPDAKIRNLEANTLVPRREIRGASARCRASFGDERWVAFSADVGWLRSRLPASKWFAIQLDHGYNATPTWTALGGALAESFPLERQGLRWLAALDPLLLVAMWVGVVWAFGWRVLCVGLLFWGTNAYAPYGWVGGGLLRQDWLAASVLGVCLLKRGHPASAGALLAWAALSRVFPAILLLGVVWNTGADLARHGWRALDRQRLRLLRAAAITSAAGIAAGAIFAGGGAVDPSIHAAGGLGAFRAFYDNSVQHLATPLQNHVGLRTALAFDPGSTSARLRDDALADPYTRWKAARHETFAHRRWIFYGAVGIFAVCFARSVRGLPDWAATALSVTWIPVATELTSYYECALVLAALLAARRARIGVALVALALVSRAIKSHWYAYDEAFAAMSVAAVAFAIAAVAWARREGSGHCDRPGAPD